MRPKGNQQLFTVPQPFNLATEQRHHQRPPPQQALPPQALDVAQAKARQRSKVRAARAWCCAVAAWARADWHVAWPRPRPQIAARRDQEAEQQRSIERILQQNDPEADDSYYGTDDY